MLTKKSCVYTKNNQKSVLDFNPSENKFERKRDHICFFLLSLSLSTLRFSPSPSLLGFFFFFFFCRSPTKSTFFASPLCIHPSTSVLCRSSPLWLLLLFADYVFALNNNFILFKSALMGDL
jgi:hypothetical protein